MFSFYKTEEFLYKMAVYKTEDVNKAFKANVNYPYQIMISVNVPDVPLQQTCFPINADERHSKLAIFTTGDEYPFTHDDLLALLTDLHKEWKQWADGFAQYIRDHKKKNHDVCEECKDKKYVKTMLWFYPCSLCWPDTNTDSPLSNKEIVKFLRDRNIEFGG